MILKDIPASARPRERLMAHGPAALADAELVALLLRTGVKGHSVLQLSQTLLDNFGGLSGLLQTQASDLEKVKGLGPAKRAEIAAVMELARRSLAQEMVKRPVFDSPQRVKDYLRMQLGHLGQEVFVVMFLDVQNHLLRFEEMFRGTLTHTSVYPREVVKRALELHASAVVFAHNHPSNVAEPSEADQLLTQMLIRALQLIDVRVLDHFVVGKTEVVSFAERGIL